MIRKLTAADLAQTESLLNESPSYNLYMLGNIASLGFEHEICEFWGHFDDSGRLRGVLNRYLDGWVVFGKSDTTWEELAKTMDEHPIRAKRLQDNPGGTESFLPYLSSYKRHSTEIQKLMTLAADALVARPLNLADVTIRRCQMEDLESLVGFYREAEAMSRSRVGVLRPLESTRIWIAADADQQILSAALTNAETDSVAMIGGVYTPPSSRGCGYSRAVCSALCADIISLSKTPILYWNTPAAGRVYERLGFEDAGDWKSVRFLPED